MFTYGKNPATGQIQQGYYSNGMFLPASTNMAMQPMQPQQQSMIPRFNNPYQYNAPTAQQMFPSMGSPLQGMFPGQGRPFMGTMPTQAQGSPMLGGSFGAGRFLSGNYANQAGLLGTSVSGT